MRTKCYVVFFSLSVALGLPAQAEGEAYQQCFNALEKRIQSYCNCEIVGNEVLVLTGPSGLRAQVGIDKTVNGLPEVAWVLNAVNKSGYPGRMKSYVETPDRDNKSEDGDIWVLEEKIRKWDLKKTAKGLEMSKPLKISRAFHFRLGQGDCSLEALKVTLSSSEKKVSKVLDDVSCDLLKQKNRLPASEKPFYQDLKNECDGLQSLE